MHRYADRSAGAGAHCASALAARRAASPPRRPAPTRPSSPTRPPHRSRSASRRSSAGRSWTSRITGTTCSRPAATSTIPAARDGSYPAARRRGRRSRRRRHAVELPSGSVAVSPVMCVDTTYPTARMWAKTIADDGDVDFAVAYAGTKTALEPKEVGHVKGEKAAGSCRATCTSSPSSAGKDERVAQGGVRALRRRQARALSGRRPLRRPSPQPLSDAAQRLRAARRASQSGSVESVGRLPRSCVSSRSNARA